jgi:hypothetical protein
VKDETEFPIQTWRRRYDHFSIEVVRRTRPPRKTDDWDGRGPYLGSECGPYLWNVYAYLYPPHWHFASFDGGNHWQPATEDMPLHGGCTFLEYHWGQGETGLVVSAVQVGCDYAHLHDDWHTRDAEGVTPFRDAVALANWLMIREVRQ